ncbi:hypothetical protein J3R82DRAFT_6754 [Butyriboletus roseoflavus]|nr:hypothetical protein J3R82DRAFT_6754 [Butyriboletus roseoflavus]
MDSETNIKLHKLKVYLDKLPDSIPFVNELETDYGFAYFGIDPQDEEDIGVEGAINRQLEIRLGHRHNGPIQLKERGPGLTGVVPVLDKYLSQLPGSIILKKWVDDLIDSAELAYRQAGCSPPDMLAQACGALLPVVTTHVTQLPEMADDLDTHGVDLEEENQLSDSRKGKKLDSKALTQFDDERYEDLPEIEDTRPTGVKLLPLLRDLTRRCQKKNLHSSGMQHNMVGHKEPTTYPHPCIKM